MRPIREIAAPFVVGVARSGTTVMRLMLDAHPQLAIPAETHFVPGLIVRWRKLEASGAPQHELRALCVDFITSHPRWGDLGISAGELEAHLTAIPAPGVADAARAVHLLAAERAGKPRWGDKTPGYLRKMRLIKRALPEARFVHVIRDGRDVALSLAEVSWGTDDVAEAAELWKKGIKGARRHAGRMPPGSYMEMRYEALVFDPEVVLREVAAFVELPWDERMLDYHENAGERMAPTVRDMRSRAGRVITAAERQRQHALAAEPPRPDRVGRWQQEMKPGDRSRFEKVAGGLLEELGYR